MLYSVTICHTYFVLFHFKENVDVYPSSISSSPEDQKNKIWSKLINRQMSKTDKTLWQPHDESVICSKHFVDNMPERHPNPTLELGYALYNTHSTKCATRTSTMASSTELPNTSVTLISTCQTQSVLDPERTEESEIFDVSEYTKAKNPNLSYCPLEA